MRVEANDDEDSDDDIEIGAATTDFKCALTMGDLKDAMTSYVFIFLRPSIQIMLLLYSSLMILIVHLVSSYTRSTFPKSPLNFQNFSRRHLQQKQKKNSKKCPHSFSAKSLREYFKSGVPTDCPIQGCPQKLTLHDFESDPALQRRVDAHLKREKEGTNARPATQFHEVSDSEDD